MNTKGIRSKELERALLSLDQSKAEFIISETAKSTSNIKNAGNLISETLRRIGESWEKDQLSLSQIYMSGMICEKIINKIFSPKDSIIKNQPKIAIAVFEDFHLLGKRIIYSTLRASGFVLQDLGGGLSIEKIVAEVKKEKIKILLISVLILSSAIRVKELIKQLSDIDVKIIVGGAPFRFDKELWREINADYCGHDSADALEIVTKLTKQYK